LIASLDCQLETDAMMYIVQELDLLLERFGVQSLVMRLPQNPLVNLHDVTRVRNEANPIFLMIQLIVLVPSDFVYKFF
jgi:hypothetical protein